MPLTSAFERVLIWLNIPFRVIYELYLCLVGSRVNADYQSVDPDQKELWQKEADKDDWWLENSPLAGLKKLNPIRLCLIGDAFLRNAGGMNDQSMEDSLSGDKIFLRGARICDVGCGGGILSEALAEAGATVTGIDMLPAAINIARRHWDQTHEVKPPAANSITQRKSVIHAPDYVCEAIQTFAEQNAGQFDIVVCSEVLEHVPDPKDFAANCCKLVRPGGCVVFTTVNRTLWALFGFILLTEDVLGIIPRYCHRLYMCVKPKEIQCVLDELGFEGVKMNGLHLLPMGLQPRDMEWVTSSFTGMGYSMVATRPK